MGLRVGVVLAVPGLGPVAAEELLGVEDEALDEEQLAVAEVGVLLGRGAVLVVVAVDRGIGAEDGGRVRGRRGQRARGRGRQPPARRPRLQPEQRWIS